MRCRELFEGAGIEIPEHIENIEISSIVTDSRKVTKNCVFICLGGSEYDGHDYIYDAVRLGAGVIVAENVRDVCVGGAAIIYVDNTRNAASCLYNSWFGSPAKKMKIIGVTGTNGKTSICYMLLNIFEHAGYSCGLIGTVETLSNGRKPIKRAYGSSMTTPPPELLYEILAEMKSDGVEYVFMEVSSHALAQCRTDAINFDAAIFTNLTGDHLDFHKNMEEYYRSKEKLFLQSRRAFVNVDDASGRRLLRSLKENEAEVFSCSLTQGDFCACSIQNREGGTAYRLKCSKGEYEVHLPLFGNFQVINSLQASALAIEFGISPAKAFDALGSMREVPGRMQEIKIPYARDIKVFIDYAHTPDAIEKLIKSAREFKPENGRILILFGCGGERECEKRKIMGQIASRLSDMVIVTSDNSRRENPEKIISDIVKGIDKEKEYAVIKDRRVAIERTICEFARSGDIVLLAGKGHEKYQIDADGIHEFDEKEIAENALKQRFRQGTV